MGTLWSEQLEAGPPATTPTSEGRRVAAFLFASLPGLGDQRASGGSCLVEYQDTQIGKATLQPQAENRGELRRQFQALSNEIARDAEALTCNLLPVLVALRRISSDGYASFHCWLPPLPSELPVSARRAKPAVGIHKKQEHGIAGFVFAFLRSKHDVASMTCTGLVLQARCEQNNFPVQT